MEKTLIPHWKSCLQSNNKKVHLDTLKDIVNSLNQAKNKTEDENFCVIFINSDLSYYLNEMLIYQHKISTNLVIKIICHLSEVQLFFKNDFFRYMKSSMRLINSFSKESTSEDEEAYYKQNILNLNTILLKRARKFNVNFNDQRISACRLIIAACALRDSKLPDKLEFINVVLDVLSSLEINEEARANQEKNLIEIIKNFQFNPDDLSKEEYFMLTINFFHYAISLVPFMGENQEIISLISGKFVRLMKIILNDPQDLSDIKCEIFLNLLYYIMKSSALFSIKYVILNSFLLLSGMSFLLHVVTKSDELGSKVIGFKARVVIAEIMLNILKYFHPPTEVDGNLDVLRAKYVNIVFKCNFNPQNVNFDNIADLSRETLMFVVFKYFVIITWNEMCKSKGELLSSMAFIMEVFKSRKIAMDKGIVSMLVSIFTSNYVNITINENELLKNASETLMKYVEKVNVIIDLNFLKWWLLHNWTKRTSYEKLINFMISPRCNEQFYNLCQDDLFAFDLKYLLQIFFDEATPTENFEKLTTILCHFQINLRDYSKFINLYEKLGNAQDLRSIYVLKIICNNYKRLNHRLHIKTCDLANKILKDSSILNERLLAIQTLVNLIHSENPKR